MKSITKKIVAVFSLVAFLTLSNTAKAQLPSPYDIQNMASCGGYANVDITYYDNTCSPMGNANITLAPGSNPIPLPPGTYAIDILVVWVGNPPNTAFQPSGPVNLLCPPNWTAVPLYVSTGACSGPYQIQMWPMFARLY